MNSIFLLLPCLSRNWLMIELGSATFWLFQCDPKYFQKRRSLFVIFCFFLFLSPLFCWTSLSFLVSKEWSIHYLDREKHLNIMINHFLDGLFRSSSASQCVSFLQKKIRQKSFWRKEKVSTRITLMPKVFCNQARLSVKQTNIFLHNLLIYIRPRLSFINKQWSSLHGKIWP